MYDLSHLNAQLWSTYFAFAGSTPVHAAQLDAAEYPGRHWVAQVPGVVNLKFLPTSLLARGPDEREHALHAGSLSSVPTHAGRSVPISSHGTAHVLHSAALTS